MEHKNTISEVKKVYTLNADNVQRGFYPYLKRLQKDASAAEADKRAEVAALSLKDAEEAQKKAAQHLKDMQRAAKKDANKAEALKAAEAEAEAAKKQTEAAKKEAQKQAEAAKKAKAESSADEIRAEAIAALADVMQRKQLKAEDFCKNFLQKYLPEIFNDNNEICSVKEVKPEDAEEVRKQFADVPEILVQKDEKLFIYKKRLYFTANSLLTLFTKAADKRKQIEAEAADKRSAAEKEAAKKEAESKRAAKFEELRKRLAAYDAEIAAKKAATEKAA